MKEIKKYDEIVMDKIELPTPLKEYPNNGIYFLIEDNKIVYVGKSKDVHNRVLSHVNESIKKFDSYSYILISDNHERDLMECFYIETLDPKYNVGFSEVKLLNEVLVMIAEDSGFKIRDKNELINRTNNSNNKLTININKF